MLIKIIKYEKSQHLAFNKYPSVLPKNSSYYFFRELFPLPPTNVLENAYYMCQSSMALSKLILIEIYIIIIKMLENVIIYFLMKKGQITNGGWAKLKRLSEMLFSCFCLTSW